MHKNLILTSKAKNILWSKKTNEIADFYYENFSIRKIYLYKNQKRLAKYLKKKKKQRSFDLWYKMPYSLLIYTSKIKFFHHMQSYLYKLNDCIIVRKQRFFYKKDYSKKNVTSFFTYRIYCDNFYKLFELMEEVADYDVNILGLEIHNKLYPIEIFSKFLINIKNDLNYFFNILNDYNKEIDKTINKYNDLDCEYQKNLFEILTLCQHTIK